MGIYFLFASAVLLSGLVLAAAAINQLLKRLCEQLPSHAFAHWLLHHESSLLLSVWAAGIAALFFFGPRLLLFFTAQANSALG